MTDIKDLPPAIQILAREVREGTITIYDINEAAGMISAYYPEGDPPEWLHILANSYTTQDIPELCKLLVEEMEK